jgi:hypothetical protein
LGALLIYEDTNRTLPAGWASCSERLYPVSTVPTKATLESIVIDFMRLERPAAYAIYIEVFALALPVPVWPPERK